MSGSGACRHSRSLARSGIPRRCWTRRRSIMPGDPYTPPKPAQSWLDCLREPSKPLKIGYALTPPWGAPFASEVTDAMKQTLSLLQDLGHALEEHAMVTDLETAWRDYNQMNSVQTVLEFDDMAKVLGRPIPESELIAFNRAWLGRGRGLSARDYAAKRRGGSKGQSARTGGTGAVRRVSYADPDTAAPAGRLLGSERARLRQIHRDMDGCGVPVSVQFFRPAGDISCPRPGPKTTFRSACSSSDVTAMKPRSFAFPRSSNRQGRGSSAALNLRGSVVRSGGGLIRSSGDEIGRSRHVEALDTDRRDVFGRAVLEPGPRTNCR